MPHQGDDAMNRGSQKSPFIFHFVVAVTFLTILASSLGAGYPGGGSSKLTLFEKIHAILFDNKAKPPQQHPVIYKRTGPPGYKVSSTDTTNQHDPNYPPDPK